MASGSDAKLTKSLPGMDNTSGHADIEISFKSESSPIHINNNREAAVRRAVSSDGIRSEYDSKSLDIEGSFHIVPTRPQSDIEAHRISNNYLFGFKKWKSHVTSRPLSERSEIVKDLYSDINKVRPVKYTTIRPMNIVYVILIGWWLSLIYILIGGLMFLTFIGREYGPYCWKLAKYFIWPFGKFVHQIHPVSLQSAADFNNHIPIVEKGSPSEASTLLDIDLKETALKCRKSNYWKQPRTYVWLVLGAPILLIVHICIFLFTWLFVVSIPIAKINSKTIRKILFLPPGQVEVGDATIMNLDSNQLHSEIIMYTHQAVNVYYYKYTVDGMNVILVNLLSFVILALIIGYTDTEDKLTSGVTKFVLSILAITPLTYYIGMALTSISAQSSFAIGALLNATFGSIVELILYVITLNKGLHPVKQCYQELVKSAIAGTILATMLFIPGLCMVAGGLKYRTQKFNTRSASVSASLLFVSIAGVFAPSVFAKIYGDMFCRNCEAVIDLTPLGNVTPATNGSNSSNGIQCSQCESSIFGLDGDTSLYDKHILPLVYACAIVLPIAYIIGLIFSLKTHSQHVYDNFYSAQKAEQEKMGGHGHDAPQWSRLKCIVILLASAVLISLCADRVTENIQPLLETSGISEFFIGVTMLAVIPELPEVVNGIQFSLQDNVSMGIEIGASTAIQVCLVQVPMLVLINLIYPMNFTLIFSDVHLFAVIFSVLVMNYTFQDGKSDYFQGSALILIYLVIMSMYYVTLTPPEAVC